MEIKVLGDSKSRKGLVYSLSTFFAQALKIDGDSTVVKVYSIPRLTKDKNWNGCVARMSPTEIHVLVDSRLDPNKLVVTLAHEFVHVKQHVRGEVKSYKKRNGETGWIWMGRVNNASYANMPWEIEARKREKVLANKLRRLIAKG